MVRKILDYQNLQEQQMITNYKFKKLLVKLNQIMDKLIFIMHFHEDLIW